MSQKTECNQLAECQAKSSSSSQFNDQLNCPLKQELDSIAPQQQEVNKKPSLLKNFAASNTLNSLIQEDNTELLVAKTPSDAGVNLESLAWEDTSGWQVKDGKVMFNEESQTLSRDSAFDSPHQSNQTTPNNCNTDSEFKTKNGCCRECMKAFSSLKKACLCQVPLKQRRTQLPHNGCKYCNCHGCNPIDIRRKQRQQLKEKMNKPGRIIDSDQEDFNQGDGWTKTKQDLAAEIQKQIFKLSSEQVSEMNMGLGVPMRTQNYILGSCRKWMSEDEYKNKRPKFNNN